MQLLEPKIGDTIKYLDSWVRDLTGVVVEVNSDCFWVILTGSSQKILTYYQHVGNKHYFIEKSREDKFIKLYKEEELVGKESN